MADWNQIKADYIRGKPYRELAEIYGVSSSTLRKKGMAEKWTDLRNKARTLAEQKTTKMVADRQAKAINMMDTITEMLLGKIMDGLKDGTLCEGGRGMRDVTGALRDIREIRGIKSEADAQEQMARIDKLRKEAQSEEVEDKEIKVVIEGDLKHYCD